MGSDAFCRASRERLDQNFYNSKDSFKKLNNSKKYKYFAKNALFAGGAAAAGAGLIALAGPELVIAGITTLFGCIKFIK